MCPHLIERFEPRLCLSVTLTAAHAMGSVAGDSVTAIVESGGNRIVGGIFKKTLPLGTRTRPFAISSGGGTDGFVASYTAEGKLNWAFALGGPGNDRVAGLAADPDGGFAVTGDFEGRTDFDPGPASTRLKSSGGTDIFIARYSSKGELRFAGQMGGSRNDHGAAVKFDPGGALLTSGTFGGRADFDPSRNFAWLDVVLDGRIFVTKLSPQGKFQWVHSSDETFHFGNDVILGGAGHEALFGDAGNDTIFGGKGDDVIHGGDGNDYLSGGPGRNALYGDAGNDQIFALNSTPDVVDGGAGFDRAKFDAYDSRKSIEALLA
jgi:Ca2+-binding RTX toxin-like protein